MSTSSATPTRTRSTWLFPKVGPTSASPTPRSPPTSSTSSNGQFKLTGTPFETAPYGFIVAKSSGLAQPLLAAVKAIMANGRYKSILDKWGVQQGAISNPGLNEATS